MSNFWTPTSKRNFHQKAVELYHWNREPCAAESYRHLSRQEADGYVLSCGEEQHLADLVSFLVQTEEGARRVSAATVEEHGNGTKLVIRIAGNETPPEEVLRSLEEIGRILEAYAIETKSRDKCCEELFDKVVTLSLERIHGRLRSKRSPYPPWMYPNQAAASSYKPLYLKIRQRFDKRMASSRGNVPGWTILHQELEELAKSYKEVDRTDNKEEQYELVKTAVRKSFAISTMGKNKSLEKNLKSLNFGENVYQSREVLEVDKIARYLALCKDLVRFCRHNRKLFSSIRFEACKAPLDTRPDGSISTCHVHGEVQLILHYEQYPFQPPPRAIGSSKSACFLCDLFIKTHGHYCISHSHKRLYHKWTIPDVNWMTRQQAERFRQIIQAMIRELTRLKRSTRQGEGNFRGFESRAHLLLPQNSTVNTSTPSILSQRTEPLGGLPTPPASPPERTQPESKADSETTPDTALDGHINRSLDTVASSSFGELIRTTYHDLPHSQLISLDTPSAHFEACNLLISVDFMEVVSGQMFVTQEKEESLLGSECLTDVRLEDIPTASEMQVNCPPGSNEVVVHLKNGHGKAIFFRFIWATRK